jgi:membrane protease YdiL (CAAX protease family)
MEISIIAKLVFISAITVLLLIKKENNQVEYFPQQTWSTREVLPVYWIFIFISLILLIFYKTYPSGRLYIFALYVSTFLAGSILMFAAKMIMGRRRIMSLKVIGARSSDLYWLLILIAIQYSILLVFLYNKNFAADHSRIPFILVYFSIILVFWPVIESVFYLGMMFIPTSRIVGLVKSAVLISLLQALSHFSYSSAEVVVNFTIFGLLGCYLYIKSKRIIVPLLLHSVINFFVLLRDIKIF